MEILKIKGNKVPARRCDVTSLEGCDEKETAYITKQKEKGKDAIIAEHARLSKMNSAHMKAEQAGWLSKRISLLGRMKDEL